MCVPCAEVVSATLWISIAGYCDERRWETYHDGGVFYLDSCSLSHYSRSVRPLQLGIVIERSQLLYYGGRDY